MLLHNGWVNNEIEEKSKNIRNQMKMKQRLIGYSESSLDMEVHSYTGLYIEKSQINILTLHLKELGEQQQTKPRVSRRGKIIKISAELSHIEAKTKTSTIKMTNECRSCFFEKKSKLTNL